MRRGRQNKTNLIYILFSVVLGLLMGWTAVDFMGFSAAGDLLCGLGLWVFITSMLAAYSQDAVRGALHVAIYLACVITGYYGHFALTGGTLIFPHLIANIFMIVIGALMGFIVWHSGAKEWLGAICISVPVSLIVAECFNIYHRFSLLLIFDIAAVIVLLILFAPGKYKKLMALPFVIVFTFALVYFNVLSGFFGAWI